MMDSQNFPKHEPSFMQRKSSVGLVCAFLAFGMLGLAYLSVPLYSLLCQVTGYGGTPRILEARAYPVPAELGERRIRVRFDANVAPGLPWEFSPETPEVTLKLGETIAVPYRFKNVGDQPSTGVATFNVQPNAAGPYFGKIECFCFTDQTLAPSEERRESVVFSLDPQIVKEEGLENIDSLTLSYTFFPSKKRGVSEKEKAL
jgi:cytochrome c oxidase assembly protein subunit 11